MSKPIISQSLTELGLNTEQIFTYNYFLTNRKPNISTMCKELEVNRMRGYQLISQLETLGLLVRSGIENTKIQAASPTLILDMLKEKSASTATVSDSLANQLPKLIESYFTSNQLPEVTFYQGKHGIQTLFNLLLLETYNGSEYLSIFESQSVIDMCGFDFAVDWIERRKSKSIPVKVISTPDNKLAKSKYTKGPDYQGEIKYLSKNYPNHGTIYIAGRKTIYVDTNKQELMVIDNEQINLLFRSIFYIIWDSL
jgi:sugar-specific transcriptional regulator TrmB